MLSKELRNQQNKNRFKKKNSKTLLLIQERPGQGDSNGGVKG